MYLVHAERQSGELDLFEYSQLSRSTAVRVPVRALAGEKQVTGRGIGCYGTLDRTRLGGSEEVDLLVGIKNDLIASARPRPASAHPAPMRMHACAAHTHPASVGTQAG